MIPCAAARARHARAAAEICLPRRRWKTYDAASLTKEALTQAVEQGLGEGLDGQPLRVDADSKTIETASGSLPLSPLLDPTWIRARRRAKKLPPNKPRGRFRKKLAVNPFARALETPIRKCANTEVSLPRYFFQDFELVSHPTTEKPWWAPGSMSFKFIEPQGAPLVGSHGDWDTQCRVKRHTPPPPPATPGSRSERTFMKKTVQSSETEAPDWFEELDSRREPAPITTYTLCRKAVIDLIGGKNKKYAMLLLRSGMAMTPETQNIVWRENMGDVLLNMFRRHAVDALISRSQPRGRHEYEFIDPCKSWAEVERVHQRGCVLWIPQDPRNAPRQYATLDIKGTSFGAKMAVHNLLWLLGGEELEHLRRESPIFREHHLLVLRQWDNIGLMRLHLLLWRIQGYLASV